MYTFVMEFWDNFRHNLFKPLLLFFYMGFMVPILGVKLEFPHVLYQGLTIFLLVAIGWHGGEELARLPLSELTKAGGFMGVGVVTNFMIGIVAYLVLRSVTRLRRVDAATVAGYYGSDSAGTFATAKGVLDSGVVRDSMLAYAAYMPVMLAVMEIPGCLVALFLVSTLRRKGMDAFGNMPDEPGYDPSARALAPPAAHGHEPKHRPVPSGGHGGGGTGLAAGTAVEERLSISDEVEREVERELEPRKDRLISPELLHEVFLNPGIFLLIVSIVIGFVSEKQGEKVVAEDNKLFLDLFQGMLCLFLLEMGMTASSKLRDLKKAGWRFIAFGLIAPNVFATIGIVVAHLYFMVVHQRMDIGTYVLFSVLCGAASYIAVPAVQRLAIPEASPTLPLAASLGLTFSYNVTIGIPLYIQIAKVVTKAFPIT
jgi:hypothetical protein